MSQNNKYKAKQIDFDDLVSYLITYLNANPTSKSYFIVSSNGTLTNDAGYITSVSFSSITSKPTTISGYGITDAFTGSYLDLTNTPTIPTNNNQLTNGAGYITSVPAQSFTSLTGKPTTLSGYGITDAYPLTGNPSAFLTSVPAQTWTSITGKPTFATIATSGLYSDLTGTPTIPTTTSQLTNDSGFISTLEINNQSVSYTLILSDANKLIQLNVATANTITVPLNSSVAYPIGTQIIISQNGIGQTSFVATGGVTINSADGALKLRVQYSTATLIKVDTDTWLLKGDISV